MSGQIYEFGPFSLDTRERVLMRDGQPVPLKPKVYETLLVLISESGHIVDKEELMRQVWPDVAVEENNLTGNIFALRRAFADYDCIETVPRRGYRFTAEVKQVNIENFDSETDVIITKPPKANRKTIESLAVLPFVNAGADPETEYLSDGITESIINNLSQLFRLRVMARSTVFRYKGQESDPQEIGRELGVQGVLVGRVVQLDGRLVIRTELVDVSDGSQIWGNQYTSDISDVFGIQENISAEISTELRLKLTGAELARLRKRYTENTEAFHAYLRGRFHLNKRTAAALRKAREHFRVAVELDPTYALAYAGLADAYTILASAGYDSANPAESLRKAWAAAVQALEIDESLAEAHTSLAFIKFRGEWDWGEAEKEFQRAIELNPGSAASHHWYAIYLIAVGQQGEAIKEITRAQELDPLSLIIASAAGRIFHFAGHYDQALLEFRKTLEMDPNYAEAHFNLGFTYAQKKMYAQSIDELLQALRLSENRTLILAVLGHTYSMAGKEREARSVLEQLHELSKRSYVSPLDWAIVYTGLGETDLALDWFEAAFEKRAGPLVYLKVEPLYDRLRDEPRFIRLLERMNLSS